MRYETDAVLARDMEGRSRLEVRIGRALKGLPTSRWLGVARRHLGARGLMGLWDKGIVLAYAPQIKQLKGDLLAIRGAALALTGGQVLWIDEVQSSLTRRTDITTPLFKFTLKDTTQERMCVSGPLGTKLHSLLVPRRAPCLLAEVDENYVFRIDLTPPTRKFP